MKRSVLIGCLAACGLALSATTVHAGTNESWNISLTTTGNDVTWTSPTAIDLGFPQYDISYNITKVETQIFGTWGDITSQLDPNTLSGNTIENSLPATLYDNTVNEAGSSATILFQINAAGHGFASITSVSLGFPVTGVRVTGTIDAAAIPEPAMLSMIGLGGLLTLARRNKNTA
ncbi:PEP-CTERM sorting domain-containing protein [Poriferisphaera sp. WC338]|uniref:PEP-CTERM sorting domain-containing protein n=1 Tax=Poriferisphaera sp. WC338 TaxID=3425129 RepID=UPI003D81837D